MEEKEEIVLSKEVRISLDNIYEYGFETFGEVTATSFIEEIDKQLAKLNKNYLLHPESRYLITKSKMYRNII